MSQKGVFHRHARLLSEVTSSTIDMKSYHVAQRFLLCIFCSLSSSASVQFSFSSSFTSIFPFFFTRFYRLRLHIPFLLHHFIICFFVSPSRFFCFLSPFLPLSSSLRFVVPSSSSSVPFFYNFFYYLSTFLSYSVSFLSFVFLFYSPSSSPYSPSTPFFPSYIHLAASFSPSSRLNSSSSSSSSSPYTNLEWFLEVSRSKLCVHFLSPHDFYTLTTFGEQYKLWSSSLRKFLQPLVNSSFLGPHLLQTLSITVTSVSRNSEFTLCSFSFSYRTCDNRIA